MNGYGWWGGGWGGGRGVGGRGRGLGINASPPKADGKQEVFDFTLHPPFSMKGA